MLKRIYKNIKELKIKKIYRIYSYKLLFAFQTKFVFLQLCIYTFFNYKICFHSFIDFCLNRRFAIDFTFRKTRLSFSVFFIIFFINIELKKDPNDADDYFNIGSSYFENLDGHSLYNPHTDAFISNKTVRKNSDFNSELKGWLKANKPREKIKYKTYFMNKFIRIFNDDFLNSPHSIDFELTLPFYTYLSLSLKKPWGKWKYLGFHIGKSIDFKSYQLQISILKWDFTIELGKIRIDCRSNNANLENIKRLYYLNKNYSVDETYLAIYSLIENEKLLKRAFKYGIDFGVFLNECSLRNLYYDTTKRDLKIFPKEKDKYYWYDDLYFSKSFVNLILNYVEHHSVNKNTWEQIEDIYDFLPKNLINKFNKIKSNSVILSNREEYKKDYKITPFDDYY